MVKDAKTPMVLEIGTGARGRVRGRQTEDQSAD